MGLSMATSPHDARLIIAGAQILQMEEMLRKISTSLADDYPEITDDLLSTRARLMRTLESLRSTSVADDSEEEEN